MSLVNSTSANACFHLPCSALIARAGSEAEIDRVITETNRRMEEAARRLWARTDAGREAALDLFARFNDAAACLERAGWRANSIRERLGPARKVFATSMFMRRCQEWPRGYPGDFETVEYFVSGVNRSAARRIGWHFEDILLKSAVVQQHCNKLSAQAAEIARVIKENGGARLLSVACGGCLDWVPVVPLLDGFRGTIMLNDSEPAALELAQRRLRVATPALRLAPGNVLRVVKRLAAGDRFDLVIAGGLFDYLPDSAVVFLLRTIVNDLLAPGGTFLFTNIAEGNPWRRLMEYGANWTLIERSVAKLHDLCTAAGVPPSALSTEREPSGLALVARVRQ